MGEKMPRGIARNPELKSERIKEGLKLAFPNGRPEWNKGKKLSPLSDSHKKKVSESLMGHEGVWKGKKRDDVFKDKISKANTLRHQKKRERYFQQHPEQLLQMFNGRPSKKVAWNKGLRKEIETHPCKVCGTETERDFCGYSCSAKIREQKHKENGMTDKLAKEHSKFMKEYANRPENIERSRKSGHDSLRKIALKKRTRIEQFMEDALKQYGINFIPESVVYVKGKVRYRVDFELPDEKVFVECDGKQWHKDPLKDKRREDIILAQTQYEGYKFERFWGSEINKDVNKCVKEILCTI